jgi:tetratricopeptide (TPR) repeat protein
MSSEIEKQLEEIEQKYILGNHKEAIEIIDDLLESKKLQKKDQLAFLAQKGEILFFQGKIEEALTLAEEIYEESKKQNLDLILLDSIILKGLVFITQAELDKLNKEIEEGEKILKKLDSIPTKIFAKRKGLILQLKSNKNVLTLNPKLASEQMLKSLEFLEITGNKFLISFCCSFIAILYDDLNDLQKSKEFSNRGLLLAKELGNKTALALALWACAGDSFIERDFKKAKELMEQAIEIVEEIDNEYFISVFSNALALTYVFLFDYENALKYYLKALPNASKLWQLIIHRNIYRLYHRLGNNELAIKHKKSRLKIAQDLNHPLVQSDTLSSLVFLLTDLKETKNAQEYLELLNQLKEQNQDKPSISLNYQYAKGYFLKSSDRIKDWTEAADIFEELLDKDEEEISDLIRLPLLLYTSELLFREIQMTGNEELLKELKQNIENVLSFARKKYYEPLEINALNLKAQIALIELKPEIAKEILIQAIEIAKEKRCHVEEKELIKELQQLEDQFEFWKKLSEKKLSLTESAKHVSLGNGIRKVTHTTDIEVRDAETGEVTEYRRLFELKI